MNDAQPTYQLLLSAEAIRSLDRLPPRITMAIAEFMTVALISDPWRLTKPLQGDLASLRAARRGDYRILLRIHDDGVVEIVRVAHRADAYRPR